MATAAVTNSTSMSLRQSEQGVPWYLWCAVLAVTSVTIGVHWDVSWHRSIGRDTFWTAAHMAIYLCGVLAGISSGFLILYTTFRRPPALVATSVGVLGFRAPLGAFLTAWGGITMLTSAPFDNWWHSAYGLDVKIVSPPHTLLILGIFAVEAGSLFLITAAMNRSNAEQLRTLQRMLLYLGGLMLVLIMFFQTQFTLDVRLHSSGAYISVAICATGLIALIWESSRFRWAGVWISGFYALVLIALILILPLFPAEPKLGPVYQPVHQFIPPQFPLLLVVPAFAMDVILQRTSQWKLWLRSVLAGPVFLLLFVFVEWPFASFLMTNASKNRFFGTNYLDFSIRPWWAGALRQFLNPESGFTLWRGLLLATFCAALSSSVGLALGKWMRKVQR